MKMDLAPFSLQAQHPVQAGRGAARPSPSLGGCEEMVHISEEMVNKALIVSISSLQEGKAR